MSLSISIAPELAGKVRLGVLVLDGVSVKSEDAALAAEIDSAGAELRTRYAGGPSAEVPGAADARALYKALGLDPTKTRPSNEALLRRVLKAEALYRVNTLVDALNLSSLRYQLPFGLYDLARVRPPVVLRKGRAGESYEGIRKGPVNVQDRPTLADEDGVARLVRARTRHAHPPAGSTCDSTSFPPHARRSACSVPSRTWRRRGRLYPAGA